jgi:hypothetical protein
MDKVKTMRLGKKTGNVDRSTPDQGCQMVCFQTKNPNLGKFGMALEWKKLLNFMAIWSILWRFGIFYDHFGTFCIHLVHLSGFGTMYQEKSGNPAPDSSRTEVE